MKDLVLDSKTGFITSQPFDIYDTNGNLFYSSTFTDHIANGKQLKFNMPAGVYKYQGSFIKLDKPLIIANVILPPKERTLKGSTKRYQIVFAPNPNKCTIFYGLGKIVFDTSFQTAPLYLKYGIYFHELGHHFYKTEHKADLYAAKKMLDYGFNPSQIGRVGLMSLTNSNFDRKSRLVKIMTKNLG